MLSQELGKVIFETMSAMCVLLILGMAANEWRRFRLADYGRLTIAAGVVLLGRILGVLVLQAGSASEAACLEWGLEGLTLALFIWAYLFSTFRQRRWAHGFLAIGLVAVGVSLAMCLLDGGGLFPPSGSISFGGIVLLLLSGFGLWQWVRHRQRSSPWLGGALAVSLVGAAAGLLGGQPLALLGHLIVLILFLIETYRAVLTDWRVSGRELEAASEEVAHQSQELAFLLELSQTVVESLDLPVVLEQASEAVARAVDADWAYILLPLDDSEKELSIAARYGWWGSRKKQDAQIHRQVIIRLADFSLLRHAVSLKRQVLANEPRDFEQFDRLHDLQGRPQSGPTLVQPIFTQNRVLGAMLLGHVDKQQTFNQADGRLCQALVAQVAEAIENARLHQEVEDQVQTLAELLLRREEEASQRLAILESINDGVLVATESGEVVYINDEAERILGVPREQLVSQTVQRLLTALEGPEEGRVAERSLTRWNGSVLEGSLSPVEGQDGSLLGHVAVFYDVTHKNRIETAKDKFIASASQELAAQSEAVRGFVEQLIPNAPELVPAQHLDTLERVVADSERMAGLVNSLIAMSETEPGTMEINARSVDMKAVVEDTVDAVRVQADKSQLDIIVNYPSDLSPAWGDPLALRQIMDNLLDNALRFTPAGGRITIWAAEAPLEKELDARNHLVISIRDTGVGIAPEEQDRIFLKFVRLETPLSVEGDGLGLGLTVVQSLVEAHRGKVLVESEPGEGSTFSLALPAADRE